jgi:hypothetical protein
MQLRIRLDSGKEFVTNKDYANENEFRLEFVNGEMTCKKAIPIKCTDCKVIMVHPIHIVDITRA